MKILGGAVKNADSTIADAQIEILEIELHDANGNFLRFPQESLQLDLTDLGKGNTPLLAHARVPDGDYDSVRFITADSGTIELTDGRKFDLVVPSGPESGIKVFFDQPLHVSSGVINRVELDFDLSNSWVAIGSDRSPQGIHEFHFKPVVHAIVSPYVDPNPDGSTETVPSSSDSGNSSGGTTSSGSGSGADTSSGSGTSTDPSSGSTSGTDPSSGTGSTGSSGGTTTIDYPIVGV